MPVNNAIYINDLHQHLVILTRVHQTTCSLFDSPVVMTPKTLLDALIPLVNDLSSDLPDGERYRRLVDAMQALFPCDAAALLRLDGDTLVPLALSGFSSDTLGRRFRVGEHPRFARLLAQDSPTRFAADSPLPDPYDGLVHAHEGELEVHDCMGCRVSINGRPWGLLTLDALAPDRFDQVDMASLQAFASLAAATVNVGERISMLALSSEQERQRADAYRLAAGLGRRELIGQSPAHQRLMDEIRLAGPSDMTVLITGETGVGKELVANAVHAASPRARKPIISINCAALPETLVESELFGHVRGAFSGAVSDRRGKFELAHGGTLFLDEVGELSLPVQAKLLRVLASGQLQRVGSDEERHVDVRLIAATNRDLEAEVRLGRYRSDFYHRLSVYPMHVPPLRERGHDILLLSGFFLEENRARLGLQSLRLDADAQEALLHYPWPGNIRELEHLIGRTALQSVGRQPQRPKILSLSAKDFGLRQAAVRAQPGLDIEAEMPEAGFREAVLAYERRLLSASLIRNGDNLAATARELGLDRANLNRLAKRLGLK
jgi:anaerobic nitric oxide reductase transcription regulator